ncbi:MAG: hypothetical protein VR73_03045 [Gammaproteobacteria bacterium BRH_c0]|nr:MAG: hypothetical protein VR73_03045 [Gammaproteobacteria bacterium BRH_c0]
MPLLSIVSSPFTLLALCLVLAHVSPGVAEEHRSFDTQLQQQLANGTRREAYDWLKSIEKDQHQNQPSYYDWLAQLAMELGEYREAIPVLQTLIAMEPRHAGARLDLVIALQLEGRSHEARQNLLELNALLKGHQDQLPEHARRQLVELNRLLTVDSEQAARPSLAGYVSLGFGHDSNANRGSDNDSITITLPGYPPFKLNLGQDSIKQADEFSEAAVHLEYGNRGNGCRFAPCRLWLAGAMTRRHINLDEYDQYHLYGGTRKTYGGRDQREYTVMLQGIRSSEIRYNGLDKRVDEQFIAGLEYRQLIPGFRQLMGSVKAEAIDERANDSSLGAMATLRLNGLWIANGDQRFNPTNRRLLWELGGSWHERPDNFSGDSQRLWLSGQYPFTVNAKWHGNINASFRWRQDTRPFSAIFFGDTAREDEEWALGINLQYSLGEDWLLSSRAAYEQTDSTIPLFDTSRLQLILGLAYSF